MALFTVDVIFVVIDVIDVVLVCIIIVVESVFVCGCFKSFENCVYFARASDSVDNILLVKLGIIYSITLLFRYVHVFLSKYSALSVVELLLELNYSVFV